ncbi:FecR family protein [Mangrovibacterium diazotrophicum]|uniref:FecR family protein n=1 Tax=Mangrovibacterium diazotrophicum TaxID=1261403 RepID=A0A419W4E9_9BACT|nr:FecR domain-containing protein [Mangrovibacterium diazotrophicum]RKD90329.1 FecR family protein [Mangrovibacterium diazotrophicum]
MKDKIDPGIIQRYKSGRHTFLDIKKLTRWFRDEKYADGLKIAVEEDWNAFRLDENAEPADLSSAYRFIQQKIGTPVRIISRKRRVLNFYYRAAAVLLIPLLVYFAYSLAHKQTGNNSEQWVEVVSPYGLRTNFELPDGTRVCLNSGTHLKYNTDFAKKRTLSIEGQAYFDVIHNPKIPFVVHTEVFDVTVLGTKFSVSSFDSDNQVDVVLEKGKVQLDGVNHSFTKVMKPDERFTFNKQESEGKIEQVDAGYLTSWKDGVLVFRNEPLSLVLKRLGRWYNVDFEITDSELMDFRYRATFKDEPLDEVLSLISLTAPITYKIEKREMNDQGSYTSKIVKISKK